MDTNQELCAKCGATLSEVITTKTGKQLRRCSKGLYNEETRKTEGCDYVKWLPSVPQELDEKCPKCGEKLVLATTRFGKKMKRCSTNVWNPETKSSTGCDYVQWITGTTEELDEDCPECGEKLVLFTTTTGKKLKKCSTNKWDKEQKMAVGCTFVEWM
jgi:ssDNA-binding Zn-finger/Zn-ribbon topoisomerase 1